MNKSKLGRLTIVILIAVGVVVVPWFVGDPFGPVHEPPIIKWFFGFAFIAASFGAGAIIIYLILGIINYIKHGK